MSLTMAAAAAQTSDTKTAVIALAGAVVGGLLTGGAQLLAEWMKSRRAHKAAASHTLGLRRVLHYYLTLWQRIVQIAIDNPDTRWWKQEVEPSAEWDTADLQMFAATLSTEQWEQVQDAMVAARNMAAARVESLAEELSMAEAFADPAYNVQREIKRLNRGCEVLAEATHK